MIHRDTVERYSGTLEELADEIGNLKYDALAEFLVLLSAKIERDSLKDESRGRVQLAAALRDCSQDLSQASLYIQKAWRICQPYMQDSDGQGARDLST